VTFASTADWSPADHPYAIAVMQAQLWRDAVLLTVHRMRDEDDQRVMWSSRQLDAHMLIMTLRQLLTAENLEQAALRQLSMNPAVGAALAAARRRFVDALPGIKDMRDGLMHFDEWTRGTGQGPQRRRRDDGDALRDIARDFSRFGYDPAAGTVEFGSYTIDIDMASRAAIELSRAIFQAAHEVDVVSTARLRQQTIQALADARIPYSSADEIVRFLPATTCGSGCRSTLALTRTTRPSSPRPTASWTRSQSPAFTYNRSIWPSIETRLSA
jgi:hypothetical protein